MPLPASTRCRRPIFPRQGVFPAHLRCISGASQAVEKVAYPSGPRVRSRPELQEVSSCALLSGSWAWRRRRQRSRA
jgi:hypothetical protein